MRTRGGALAVADHKRGRIKFAGRTDSGCLPCHWWGRPSALLQYYSIRQTCPLHLHAIEPLILPRMTDWYFLIYHTPLFIYPFRWYINCHFHVWKTVPHCFLCAFFLVRIFFMLLSCDKREKEVFTPPPHPPISISFIWSAIFSLMSLPPEWRGRYFGAQHRTFSLYAMHAEPHTWTHIITIVRGLRYTSTNRMAVTVVFPHSPSPAVIDTLHAWLIIVWNCINALRASRFMLNVVPLAPPPPRFIRYYASRRTRRCDTEMRSMVWRR